MPVDKVIFDMLKKQYIYNCCNFFLFISGFGNQGVKSEANPGMNVNLSLSDRKLL